MRAQIAFLFKKFTPELARLTPNKTHCRRTRTPFYGSRRMTAWLQAQGYRVNRKRVARLMRIMGIEAVYAKPKLSQPGEGHKIYPYLLKGLKIERCVSKGADRSSQLFSRRADDFCLNHHPARPAPLAGRIMD